MAKNKLNKYIGAVTMGALILAAPSCSDTWDDHYAPLDNTDPEATQTLWEQISSDPNLSRFAAIVQKAKYYKDETHPVATFTFADLLSSNQVTTVWAPDNSSFSDEDYQYWLQKCEEDGYTVQQQFLGNHIAVWRYALNGEGIDTLKMINGKNLAFDRDAQTIQGVKIVKKNTPAVNGTLHTINGFTPFDFNFYEYIKYTDNLPELRKYVLSKDTTYFYQNASIEGLPDKDGNPTYVDSVYRTSNRLFNNSNYLPTNGYEKWLTYDKGFGGGSDLTAEDSMFIMLMPTDAAWKEAIDRLSQYYQYAPVYVDKYVGIKKSETTLTDINADSLSELSLKMDLVSSLLFNIHKQGKIGGPKGTPWTLDMWLAQKGDSAEYLLNTRGDTLRTTALWDQTSLFNGQVVEMSNGYGYQLDKWAFPSEYYKPDVEIELGWSTLYDEENNCNAIFQSKSFSNVTYQPIVDRFGKVSKNNFYMMKEKSKGSNPKAEIKLQGNLNEAYVPSAKVMSGNYDVYVVMVPHWYEDLSNFGEVDSLFLDSAYVDSMSSISKNKFTLQITYNAGTAKEQTSSKVTIDYDGTKVDTILAIPDFNFPYSYKNLSVSRGGTKLHECFPTITIQSNPSSTEVRSKGYTRELCIDRIILKSKENIVPSEEDEEEPEQNNTEE